MSHRDTPPLRASAFPLPPTCRGLNSPTCRGLLPPILLVTPREDVVTPVKTGVQGGGQGGSRTMQGVFCNLDSRLRGNDAGWVPQASRTA